MDPALVDRIQADMRFEFARTAPPDGFPAFHEKRIEIFEAPAVILLSITSATAVSIE